MFEADDNRLSRNYSVNATGVAFTNVNRNINYSIGVAAKTAVGTGPISKMKFIQAKRK